MGGHNSRIKEAARAQLLEYIAGMEAGEGGRLPSEQKLCAILSVSRITLRAVLDELVGEGRLIRPHGMQCHVNPEFHRIKASIFPFRSIEHNIRAAGYLPSVENRRCLAMPASEAVADALKLRVGDEVIRSEHIFFADGEFCILCYDYIDASLLSRQDIHRLNLEDSVVFKLLYEKTGKKITWDLMEVSAADSCNTPELCQYCLLPPSGVKPFLLTLVTAYDSVDRPLLYSTTFYDAEYFKFGMVRKRRYNFDDFKCDDDREMS